MIRSSSLCTRTLAGVLMITAGACAQVELRPVALSGTAAPGGVGVFEGVGPPTINNAGVLAFSASTPELGVWRGDTTSVERLIARSDQIPGVDGLFGGPRLPLIVNDDGSVYFSAERSGTGITSDLEDIILRIVGTTVEPVAVSQGASPVPGATWTFDNEFTVSSQGVIALVAELEGPGFTPFNNDGLFRGVPGDWERLLIRGEPSPYAGLEYFFPSTAPPINAQGRMACAVRLGEFDGDSISNTQSAFVFAEPDGSVTPIVLEGDPSPEPGLEIRGIGGAPETRSFNDAGQGIGAGSVGFTGSSQAFPALLAYSDNGVEVVARAGERAPGASGEYVSFQSAVRGVVINANGTGAFIARIDNGLGAIDSGLGLYRFEGGEVQPLALRGQSFPLLGAGIKIGAPLAPSINANGRIVSRLSLEGAVTEENDSVLVATDDNGVLVPVLRTGDTVDIDPSESVDMRTVQRIEIVEGSGGQDGRARCLNDNDELAVFLRFTDHEEGVFVLSLANLGTTVVCEADIDGDGDVDLGDFGIFGIGFGSEWNVGIDYDPRADYDLDGDVDLGDFGIFGQQFGRTDCPGQ